MFTIKTMLAGMLLVSGTVFAMEKAQPVAVTLSESLEQKLAAIKPFQETFTHIPQFLYGNPSQHVAKTWSKEYFEQLKGAAGKLNQEAFLAQLKREQEKLKSENKPVFDLNTEFKHRAEGYDWICALTFLEQNYMRPSNQLRLEDLLKINAAILKNTNTKAGVIRDHGMSWFRKRLSNTERFLCSYVSDHEGTESDRFLRKHRQGNYLSSVSILSLLFFYQQHPDLVESTLNIDPDELSTWLKEQTVSEEWKDFLDYEQWFQKRFLLFPEPKLLKPLIKSALKPVYTLKHPIAQAAYLWFKIIEIHVFDGAHKRTGKAAAIPILLKSGYLPPVISGDDGEKMVQILMDNIGKENGHIPFIEFIADLIIKTQKEYQGKTL